MWTHAGSCFLVYDFWQRWGEVVWYFTEVEVEQGGTALLHVQVQVK